MERPSRQCAPSVARIATSTVIDINGRIAQTTVTETFENRGATVGEADFLFPLPHGAAFEELRLEIDGELVAGEVLDAARAKATYERIVRELRDPALVEWAGLGMVRTRIFPFRAGERRTVVVKHRHVLPREGDALRVSGTLVGVDDPRDERATGTFRIRWSDDSLGTPWSPTHSVKIRSNSSDRTVRDVSLTGRAGDVVAYLPVRSAGRAAGVTVLTHSARGERHALVIVSPPRETPRPMPRDISLVLDVSGSMQGTKMTQAIAAGNALLASLQSNDRFRLIAFSDEITAHSAALVDATPANVRRARSWLNALEARGGTNIGDALREALTGAAERSRDDARLPLVLLITDGQPTNGLRSVAILDSTSVWRGDARVFTFGVGEDVDASLVEQIALVARGAAQFIRPDESVERAVALVAQRLAAPLLSNVRVHLDGGQLRQLYAPYGMDLMAGQELVFLARYTGSSTGRVRITGTSGGETRVMQSSYQFATRDSLNAFVPRLWAVQRVAALDTERRRSGPNAEIDGELRLLGERFGVPTPLTSYLVLEPNAVVAQRTRAIGAAGGRLMSAPSSPDMSAKAGNAAAPAVAFESARRASEQRAVVTMSAADQMLSERDADAGRSRVVDGRLFDLIDSVWTDRRLIGDRSWKPEQTVRVKPFSAAWMALANAVPSIREAMALGDRVRVRGNRVLVEVTPDGVEQLDAVALRQLVERW
jgi:Ca-activated chloride channel family protein